MEKYLLSIGVVWVGLSLVIGLVLVLNPNNQTLSTQDMATYRIIKEVYYVQQSDVPQKSGSGSGVAEVNIEGTYGYEGDQSATAQVNVE